MAVFVFAASTYGPFLYSPNPGGDSERARINIAGGGYNVYLIFSDTLGTNTYNAATQTGVAYAAIDDYVRYVDMFRNGKSVSVTVNPDSAPVSYVFYFGAAIGE